LIISHYKQTILFNYLSIGVNILVGFILFPLIIEYLGLATLGVFGVFYGIKNIIDLGVGWFSGAITKNLAKYKHLKNNISTLSFIINWGYGLVGALFFMLYGYFAKNEYFVSAIYFSIFVFVSFAWLPYSQLLVEKSKQHKAAFFRFLGQLFFLVSSVAFFIFAENKSLDIIFLALALSNIALLVLIHFYYTYHYKIVFEVHKFSKKLFAKLFLVDGSKFLFNGVSTVILLQIDILLIDYLYGSISAGIYVILWKIPNTLIMLGWRLGEPFQIIVAKNIRDKQYLKTRFYSLERQIFFVSLVFALGYIFLGDIFLDIWIGRENIPHIDYMFIIPAMVIIFSAMQRLYMSVNYYTNNLNIVSFLQMVEILFKVLFIILFFENFAELSSIIGWLCAFILTFLFYRKYSIRILS
jgi:O-antigen/teichoic acid export membrane protein